jgi:hypothetical protein
VGRASARAGAGERGREVTPAGAPRPRPGHAGTPGPCRDAGGRPGREPRRGRGRVRRDRATTGAPSWAQDEGARAPDRAGRGRAASSRHGLVQGRAMAGTCAALSRGRPTARAGGCAGCSGREPAALAEPGREGEGRGRGRREGRGSPRARAQAGGGFPGDENDGERRKKHHGEEDEQGTTAGAYRRAPRAEAVAT